MPRLVATTLLLLAAGCSRPADSPPPLVLFVAASAAGIAEELCREFERETGIAVRVSAAASSVLARQIEEGARADLFLSAHDEWLDHLARLGRLERARARLFARNALVIVAGPHGPAALPPPPAVPERIAVADPAHVPLGKYARQALESLGRWEAWGPRLLPALDAAAAVEYVRSGDAPVGIVYRTDARAHPELRVLEEIAPALHEPIELRIAPLEGADPRAERLLDFLTGETARARLAARGFIAEAERTPAGAPGSSR